MYFLRPFCSSPLHCPQCLRTQVYSSLCSLTCCIQSWILFQLPAHLNLCRSPPAGVLISPTSLVDLLNANYLLAATQSPDKPTPSTSPAPILIRMSPIAFAGSNHCPCHPQIPGTPVLALFLFHPLSYLLPEATSCTRSCRTTFCHSKYPWQPDGVRK